MHRELIEELVCADEAEFYPPAKLAALDHADRMLGRSHLPLPSDYRTFLAESDGFCWNGIRIFGLGAAGASRGLMTENREAWRDIPALKRKLVVGRSESFHLTYDPAAMSYGRLYREGMTPDPAFRAQSFAELLAASITERLPLGGLSRPATHSAPIPVQ
jgi:hypothetical protein